MKKLYVLFQIFIFIFVSCFSSQNKNNDIVQEKIDMADIQPSRNICKPLTNANPISSNVFCADPTGVEYEGRLYVYGTNDHQQYATVGKNGKNTYEHIKSLVCFCIVCLSSVTSLAISTAPKTLPSEFTRG